MRFKKGDKVEVMSRKEGPVSWHLAEVLSCNGQSLCLRYVPFPGAEKELMVETVSWKFVRPDPPLVQVLENCISGDIVEVFYHFSWNIAAIVKNIGSKRENRKNKSYRPATAFQNQYLVRVIGSSEELIIDQSNIRLRQTWDEGKWILMGKTSQRCVDTKASKPSTSNCYQKMNFQVPLFNACPATQNDFVGNDVGFGKSPAISARSLKRISPYGESVVEAHNGPVCKFRAVEKDGRRQITITSTVLEKVDAVAYPREVLGKKNMHASFKNISYGSNQTERAKQNDDLGCSRVRISESSSSQSDASSVGSCSVANQKANKFSHFIPPPCQAIDTLCSDAESCCGSDSVRESCPLPSKKELEVSIHRFELHAYRNTLEALYASGPLSWEREALLTNLRFMLNISNDEHLMEGHCWRHGHYFKRFKDDTWICQRSIGIYYWMISHLLLWLLPDLKNKRSR